MNATAKLGRKKEIVTLKWCIRLFKAIFSTTLLHSLVRRVSLRNWRLGWLWSKHVHDGKDLTTLKGKVPWKYILSHCKRFNATCLGKCDEMLAIV